MSDDTTPTSPDLAMLEGLDPETRAFFELMMRDEPLDSHLVPYVEEDGPLGPMLRHPLVYEMTMQGVARINERFRQKTDAAARALHEGNWHTFIWLHERPHRLDALKLIEPQLKPDEFWMFVRDVWVDSENIWQNFDEWLEVLADDRPARSQFMTPGERKLLRALPAELTVYRGCMTDLNDDGLSWTLDKSRAEWFAKRFEREGHDAVVLVGTVPKKLVLGYLAEARGEEEVVVRHPIHVNVTGVEYV